ncbi:hypothetical protein N7470_002150 [Penicillium chermesinum]|nr:hypothetical protein N7470_002150 [Penicillium chermesinum]
MLSTSRNVDIISHYGLEQKNWPLADALLNTLIDTNEMLIPFVTPRVAAFQSFDWGGKHTSLSALTNAANLQRTQDGVLWQDGGYNPVKPLPLPNSIDLHSSTMKPTARYLADSFLAQTLMSLGSIVLAAADKPLNESRIAMSYVYRALARMHHLDLLSNKLYQDPTNTWLEHQAALASAATRAGQEPPFVSFNVGVRELGPEIWFEYILWCCVEHGFVRQGAWLVKTMQSKAESWKTESWEPLLKNLDIVRDTNISREQSWRRPGNDNPPETFRDMREKPAFNGLGKKTISTEVVLALRAGLPIQAYNGLGFHGLTPQQLIRLMRPLNAALGIPTDDQKLCPTRKISTTNIFRILDSGAVDPVTDPAAFEQVIRSTRNNLDRMTKTQLSDETSAMIGLAEYSVRAYSNQGQSSHAFSEYSRLQNLIDASKFQHITSFFEKLRDASSEDLPFFNSKQLEPSLVPESSVPQVSNVTLAGLLDLATAGHHFNFGKSLVFDDSVDNPPIPASSYHDQALIPALLRFADATENTELSSQILSKVRMPLSVNTLNAMLAHYVNVEDWDRVIMISEYTRDFRLKSWGYSTIMTLAAKILRLEAEASKASYRDQLPAELGDTLSSLARAKNIFFRFFEGEFNNRALPISRQKHSVNFQQKALQRLHAFFLSLPGPLSDIMQQVKLKKVYSGQHKLSLIPSKSFNVYLHAVIETGSSYDGYLLCRKWCLEEVEKQPFMEPGYSPKWAQAIQHKAIMTDITTIRILAQAACREFTESKTRRILHKEASRQRAGRSPDLAVPRPSEIEEELIPSSQNVWPGPSDGSAPPVLESSVSGYKLDVPLARLGHQSMNGGKAPRWKTEAVLDYCVAMYLRLGLSEEQIDLELPGYSSHLRHRGVLTNRQAKRVRDRYKEIQNSPWMDSYVQQSLSQ